MMPKKLALAHLPTPIHRLDRLSAELGKNLYVWRDDLTGFAESGNKIRKLEFLFAEAQEREADVVITCGGPQSNHARATAVLARRLGMRPILLVRQPLEGGEARWTGNVLLDHLVGAELRPIPYEDYVAAGEVYEPFLEEVAAECRDGGEVPYVIPEGGSNALGSLGYFHAVSEMLETWRGLERDRAPDHVFHALGSGGTSVGLILGFEANELDPSSVCAINICDDRSYFESHTSKLMDAVIEQYGLKKPASGLRIFDGYVGEGYAKATEEELEFYVKVARSEGVILDPCYTGKAFRGMIREVDAAPESFGQDILFLHSGGGFGNFAYETQYLSVLKGSLGPD